MNSSKEDVWEMVISGFQLDTYEEDFIVDYCINESGKLEIFSVFFRGVDLPLSNREEERILDYIKTQL